MNNFLYLLSIPFIRFLINFNNWFYLRSVLGKHTIYLKGAIQKDPEENVKKASNTASEWIVANMTEIKAKVAGAGVKPSVKSFMEPVGYGHVKEKRLNVIDNLLFLNEEIVSDARHTLEMAKGHYWNQALSSLSPLFWGEILFFLPRAIISASGIDTTSKVVDIFSKIAQILYWLAIVVVIVFRPDLFDTIFKK